MTPPGRTGLPKPWPLFPSTLSPRLLTDLLRRELGFEGVIVSDAAPMVGMAGRVTAAEQALQFILAGGDIYLFSEPELDYPPLLNAARSGRLPATRLDDAVRRILELKARLAIHDTPAGEAPGSAEQEHWRQTATRIAEAAPCLYRNDGALPLHLDAGARVATVHIYWKESGPRCGPLATVDAELAARGFQVSSHENPDHKTLARLAAENDAVFVNLQVIGHSIMGVTRMIGHMAMSFWRGFWTEFPGKVIFTAFGSPYVFYEQPHLPNMLALFSPDPASQRAAVRVWLGEIPARASSPVHIPYIAKR